MKGNVWGFQRISGKDNTKDELQEEFKKAPANLKALRGLVPICAWCKKARDGKGCWKRVETYLEEHSDAKFTHGICPKCEERVKKRERRSS